MWTGSVANGAPKNIMVRAKFRVESVEPNEGDQVEGSVIKLWPVTSGSEENEKFFNLTPSGHIELGTINPEAAKQFEVGKEYYVDFTPAE